MLEPPVLLDQDLRTHSAMPDESMTMRQALRTVARLQTAASDHRTAMIPGEWRASTAPIPPAPAVTDRPLVEPVTIPRGPTIEPRSPDTSGGRDTGRGGR